jgi:hypothetical protein
MRLFEVAKVGCFLDAIGHSLEKRRGDDVKVLNLTLRIAPFTSQLASAMPDGVKPSLFKLSSGDPKESIRRIDFALGCERQLLTVYAAPDTTQASIALDQVKVSGTYARAQKDRNGFDFVLKASFGPVGKTELEFVQDWLLTQRFVSFEEAEPGMFDEAEETDATGDDDDAGDDQPQLPAHEFETASDGRPVGRREQLQGLQALLMKAGAKTSVTRLAQWSAMEIASAQQWAQEQLAANEAAEDGKTVSVQWPKHVSNAHADETRMKEPARRIGKRHVTKKPMAKARARGRRR